MSKTIIYIAIFNIVLISACSNNQKGINENEKYPVTTSVLMDTVFNQEYVADIQAVQNVEIRTRINGYIDKIYVDEGQSVQAGQLLYKISSLEFEQELLRANAMLKSALAESKMAEVQVNNTRLLAEKNIVSQSEVELAKAKFESAQASIDEARSAISSANLNISFASIKAPFNGVINRQILKTGSLIDEGTLLTTISDNSEVFAYFHVSEKEYLSLQKENGNNHKKEAKLLLADGQAFSYSGNVEIVESEIDKNTGNIAFRARFKNTERLLKHGASGKIQLINKLSNALVIPQKATFEIQEKTYVFVVGSDSIVKSRMIVIKQRLSHLYVVESGLEPNEQIIYEGIQQVKDGDKIIPEIKPILNLICQLGKQ